MSVTTIDLIRHGEPVGGRMYRGQIDHPLSEKGWQQMWTAVGDQCPWQHIASSPLTRCVDFAHELAAQHNLSLSVHDSLKEIAFGIWEGKTRQQIEQESPGSLSAFYADPITNRPQGAEPLHSFRQRIAEVIQVLLTQHTGQHILVVCHAGVMRMALLHFLDIPAEHAFRIQVANAALTRFEIEHAADVNIPRLLFHNGQL
jgi:alpha-ribazole phosphatase